MVVQTQAHLSAESLRSRALPWQSHAGFCSQVAIGGAVVVVEVAWLLTLAWGVYTLF